MKKIILLLILVPFIGFPQANKLFRQAKRTSDLNEKIKLYTQVIELEPNNLDAYFFRALAKNDLGDYGGAIVDYSKIIVEEPDADTYYNRGNSRFSIKDFTGAKEDYAKAYMLDANFIDALYSLACVKFELGEYETAIKDFTKVIEKNPSLPKAHLLRAMAYTNLGLYKKAIEDYTAAILIEPSADHYFNRGAFFMDLKYFKEAKRDLNRAIRLNKNNAFAYFYRGASKLMLGEFLDAIPDFKTAIKFDPNDFDAYLGLAMTYYKLNDIEQTKTNFNKANDILGLGKNVNHIDQYQNTYWYENQYQFFNLNIPKVAKLAN